MFRDRSDPGGDPGDRREAMVERLLEAGRISDPDVAEALRAVPRHEFVPPGRRENAYADTPLPIGDDQTISAPHMVGIMAELLEVEPGDDVLEVGTGCGYHAAVTAELVDPGHVYGVEYGAELADSARETLDRLGYDNVEIRVGDGREGWPEHAPFDAAYLTAAPAELPDPIAEQTRPGGRIVAPVGTRSQTLYRYTAGEDGVRDSETHGAVRFVTMRG